MAAAAPARGGAAQVGVGESSSPPRGPSPAVYASGGSGSGGGGGAGAVGGGLRDVFREVFERLVADGHAKTLLPDLRARLETHFARLPTCYQLDVNIDKEEHVLVRLKVLAEAKDLNKHSAFTVCVVRLEEINADEEPNSDAHKEGADTDEALFTRLPSYTKIHEIILSTTNKPKALSQLSSLLSDIGLNIREAHVFSTTNGYSLNVFIVDGWAAEDTDGWYKALESSILRKEGSWSASYSASASSERSLLFQVEDFKSDIDTEPLKIVKRSLADLVGILVRRLLLKSLVLAILLNGSSWNEFKQEILMLREADYPNSVQFIASCTKPPVFYIFTECMSRENLFDFLHNEHNFLDFPTVLKFAPDICRGMSYLQEKRNVHGDLKSANHLLNKDHVVKVADFGLAHFQDQKGAMTAETETYRWMAPEMPNTNMAPVQAVVDVRKELHPQLPENAYPRLLNMMRICWEPIPSDRPSFSDIIAELQDIQAQAQGAIKSERQDLNYMGGEETSSFAPKTQVFIELPRKTLSLQVDINKDVVNLRQEIEKRTQVDSTYFFFTYCLAVLEESIPLSSYGIRRGSRVQMRCRLRGGKKKMFETLFQFFEKHISDLLKTVQLPDGSTEVELTDMGYLILSSWIHCFTSTFVAGKTWFGLFDLHSFEVVKGRVMISLKPKEGLTKNELSKDVKRLINYIREIFTLRRKYPPYILHLLTMLEELDVDILSQDQKLALDAHASLIPSMNLVSLIYHIKRKFDGWYFAEKERFRTVLNQCNLPVDWLTNIERVPIFCDVISKALSNNCIYEPNGSGAFFLTRNYNTHAPEYSMVNFNGRQYQLFQCDNGMDLMVPKYLENFTADLLNVLIKENFDIRDLLKVFACSTCCMGDPESSSSSSSDDSSKIRRWDDESSSLSKGSSSKRRRKNSGQYKKRKIIGSKLLEKEKSFAH